MMPFCVCRRPRDESKSLWSSATFSNSFPTTPIKTVNIQPRPTLAKPLLLGDWADIAICQDGSDYYLTQSSGMYRPAALLWHSTDLRVWRPIGYAVENHPGCVWITDLVKDGNDLRVFWLSTFKRDGGFVASAPAWRGPWSRPQATGLPPDAVMGVDDDGTRYAFTGHGYVQRLQPGGLAPVEEPRRAYHGWMFPEDWAVEMYPCIEAPKIFKARGWWYLIEAQGGTFGPSTSHMMVAARAKSPYGPWENSPHNPIIRTWSRSEVWWSKGHGQLVEGPGGQWYCVLHAIPNGYRSLGRCTVIEPIEWTDDGWFRVPDRWPAGWEAGARVELPLSDDFSGTTLGLQWQFWAEIDRSRFTVGGGVLALQARGDTPGNSFPLTVPAMHYAYEVETEVELVGENVAAGLMLFAKPGMYLGLSLSADGVVRRVQEHYRRYEWATDPSAGVTRVGLKIVNDHQDARFYYRVPGEDWRIVQPSMEVSFGCSLNVQLRPALFACGQGVAKFHGFSYRVLDDQHIGLRAAAS